MRHTLPGQASRKPWHQNNVFSSSDEVGGHDLSHLQAERPLPFANSNSMSSSSIGIGAVMKVGRTSGSPPFVSATRCRASTTAFGAMSAACRRMP